MADGGIDAEKSFAATSLTPTRTFILETDQP
jgi:hypothetical protein